MLVAEQSPRSSSQSLTTQFSSQGSHPPRYNTATGTFHSFLLEFGIWFLYLYFGFESMFLTFTDWLFCYKKCLHSKSRPTLIDFIYCFSREHPLTPGSSRQSLQGSSKDSDLFKSLHKRRASDVTVTSPRAVDVCSPAPAAAAREIQTSNRLSSSYSQRGAPGKDPRTKSKKSKGKSSGSGMFKFHEYKVRKHSSSY